MGGTRKFTLAFFSPPFTCTGLQHPQAGFGGFYFPEKKKRCSKPACPEGCSLSRQPGVVVGGGVARVKPISLARAWGGFLLCSTPRLCSGCGSARSHQRHRPGAVQQRSPSSTAVAAATASAGVCAPLRRRFEWR